MAMSVGGWVEVVDMRKLPAQSLLLRVAIPMEDPRLRWTDELGE